MISIFALGLAQATLIAPAPPTSRAVTATAWSCTLEKEDGARFRLSGRIDEVPAGWDPNRSRPTQIEGEGLPLLVGRASSTADEASEHFRDYQIGIVRGNENYYVNLKLRRDGPGVAYVTRFVSGGNRQPYFYFAVGLCTARFDAAPEGSAR